MDGGTILIVEDDPIQREGLRVVLSQHGFSVYAAEDGREAMAILKDVVPSVILLDMLIPSDEGDGWWFLQKRRKNPHLSSIPVLITTALAIASDEWAVALGADGLIHKPYDPELLVATLRNLV